MMGREETVRGGGQIGGEEDREKKSRAAGFEKGREEDFELVTTPCESRVVVGVLF